MFKTTKGQIITITAGGVLSLASLLGVIFFTDPAASTEFTFAALYSSLFLASFCFFTVLGLLSRNWWNDNLYVKNFSNSLRQAALISLLITGSLALRSQNLLYWWTEGSFVLLLIFIEIFFNLKI